MSLVDHSQQWYPSIVQVTVLQARGLRIKGKNGTNDAYAVMLVAKEKFSTSVVEKTVSPMWKEEATFELPLFHHESEERCTLQVHVMHRSLMGPDKLLGRAVVNLLELNEVKSRNKTEWFKLLDKSGKLDKDRGEVLLDIKFMRNNMTASMLDLSATNKSCSRLDKLKDKVRGKKKEGLSDSASAVVPSFSQVLTDSEEEAAGGREGGAAKDGKKKHKLKSLFSPKSNLQRNMSQSMSVLGPLPERNTPLSGSRSSGLNVGSSEGKKKFRFLTQKKPGSSDNKGQTSSLSPPGLPKPDLAPAAEQTNLCINGSHMYKQEPQPRSARAGSTFSVASSGLGSMEDLHRPQGRTSSNASIDSLRALWQPSAWAEEGNSRTTDVEEEVEEQGILEESRKAEDDSRICEEQERMRKVEEEDIIQQKKKESSGIEGMEIICVEEKRKKKEEEKKRVEEEIIIQFQEQEQVRIGTEKIAEEERKRRLLEEQKRAWQDYDKMEGLGKVGRIEEQEMWYETDRLRREKEVEVEEEEKERSRKPVKRVGREEEEEKRSELEKQRRIREKEEERITREVAEERRKIEEERMRREETEERRKTEEEGMRREETEEERMRREESEKRMKIEEERIRREEAEERRKTEEERMRKEEAEERREIEEERMRREEAEERRKTEKERMRKEEEEERRKKEEERMRREEEEERRKTEKERMRKEEEKERMRREEAEVRRKIEEERMREEAEKRRKTEEERMRREEAEERRKIEEERIRREEDEERRKKEEERMRREETEERMRREEAEVRRKIEEERMREEAEERRKSEEERMRREEAEERSKTEEERMRKEEAEERRKIEEERMRMEEAEERRKIEEERVRREEDEERRKKEEERMRREEAEERRKTEEERMRKEEEEERLRREEAEERRRKEKEEERIMREEEDERRNIEEEKSRQEEEYVKVRRKETERKERETEERVRREVEEKRIKTEEDERRKEEEGKRKEEAKIMREEEEHRIGWEDEVSKVTQVEERIVEQDNLSKEEKDQQMKVGPKEKNKAERAEERKVQQEEIVRKERDDKRKRQEEPRAGMLEEDSLLKKEVQQVEESRMACKKEDSNKSRIQIEPQFLNGQSSREDYKDIMLTDEMLLNQKEDVGDMVDGISLGQPPSTDQLEVTASSNHFQEVPNIPAELLSQTAKMSAVKRRPSSSPDPLLPPCGKTTPVIFTESCMAATDTQEIPSGQFSKKRHAPLPPSNQRATTKEDLARDFHNLTQTKTSHQDPPWREDFPFPLMERTSAAPTTSSHPVALPGPQSQSQGDQNGQISKQQVNDSWPKTSSILSQNREQTTTSTTAVPTKDLPQSQSIYHGQQPRALTVAKHSKGLAPSRPHSSLNERKILGLSATDGPPNELIVFDAKAATAAFQKDRGSENKGGAMTALLAGDTPESIPPYQGETSTSASNFDNAHCESQSSKSCPLQRGCEYDACQIQLRSLKKVRAPLPPAKSAVSCCDQIWTNQNTDSSLKGPISRKDVSTSKKVISEPCHAIPASSSSKPKLLETSGSRQQRPQKSEAIGSGHGLDPLLPASGGGGSLEPFTASGSAEEAGKNGEQCAATSPRPLLVKPLSTLEHQPICNVPGGQSNISSLHDGVQESIKAKDSLATGPYTQLTNEELISLVVKQHEQLSLKDKTIAELERYIDNLLVRVIEESPHILMSLNSIKRGP